MSQAGSNAVNAASLPSDVPLQFTSEDASISVPVNHNLNVVTSSTDDSFDNGIHTFSAGEYLTIELTNRTVTTDDTSDGLGQNKIKIVADLDLFDNASVTFRSLVTGYCTNGTAVGGEIIGLARKVSGTTVIVSTNDIFDESDAALATTDYNIEVVANNLYVNFLGIAGLTIHWKCLFEYIISTPTPNPTV